MTQGRTLAGFTIPQGDVTYIVLAELSQGKWAPYWSFKLNTADYDNQFMSVLMKEYTNVEHLLDNVSCTDDNVNDEVQELSAAL